MVTFLDSIKSVSAYPIPLRTIYSVLGRRGIGYSDEATEELLAGVEYNLAVADILMWLSGAPDISQGGQSFSFTDAQRTEFKNRAKSLYSELGAENENDTPKTIYGYKGNRL